MLVLTLLVATMVATFAFGYFTDIAQDEPVTSFETEQEGSNVTLTHTGGDVLDGENVYIVSESEGGLGNFDGSDGQACNTTVDTVEPGTDCVIPDAPTGDLQVIWRSASRSAILFEGMVFDFSGQADGGGGEDGPIQEIEEEELDTQSSQLKMWVETTASEPVEITAFSVDATAVSPDIWIDDGNNPEFYTSGATVDGSASSTERKQDSFNADGTVYTIVDYEGTNPEISPDDDSVSITFRNFGPDDEWIEDSDDLAFTDTAADADVIVTLETAEGGESTIYLEVV